MKLNDREKKIILDFFELLFDKLNPQEPLKEVKRPEAQEKSKEGCMEPKGRVIGPVKSEGFICRVAETSDGGARVEIFDSSRRCWRAAKVSEVDAADVMTGARLSETERSSLTEDLCAI